MFVHVCVSVCVCVSEILSALVYFLCVCMFVVGWLGLCVCVCERLYLRVCVCVYVSVLPIHLKITCSISLQTAS